MTGPGGLDVGRVRREQFPVTRRWAWFDHATFGPPPAAHVDAVERCVRAMAEGTLPAGAWAGGVDRVRGRAAALVGCAPADVAFLKSTAECVGLVALGLEWRSGDEVVVYEREFPAGVYPWLALRDRGVRVRFVPDRGRRRFDAADVEELMTDRTRVVCVSLVNANSGFRAPVERLGPVCRERGALLVVDATQAAGALRIDVGALGCDVLAAHAYKFLMSGYGTALCYVSPDARRRLRVATPGWKSTGTQPGGAGPYGERLELSGDARRFEPSIQHLGGLFGLEASLDVLLGVGPELVERRVLERTARIAGELEARGWRVVSSRRRGEASGIVSADRPGADIGAVDARLRAAGVAVAVRDGCLRIASHFYNDGADTDRLLAALETAVTP